LGDELLDVKGNDGDGSGSDAVGWAAARSRRGAGLAVDGVEDGGGGGGGRRWRRWVSATSREPVGAKTTCWNVG
jgi:hypothetical protein